MKGVQKVEKNRQEHENKEKLLARSQMLVQQHHKELANLKKKHDSQRKGLLMQKEKEFQIIERRFVNVWNELESKFRKQLLSLDKLDSVKKMKMREEKFQRRIAS